MSDSNFYNYLDPIIDSEATILAIRAKAMELYAKGVYIMEWSSESNEGKREFVAPIQEILRETRMALKQKNPGKYGPVVRQSQIIRVA